jgi:Mg-chelatase subunit ChlD
LVTSSFLKALTITPNMHTATAKSILQGLKLLAIAVGKDSTMGQNIDELAETYGFNLAGSHQKQGRIGFGNKKRVTFIIDYSGSMSGTKIRAAVHNVENIFQNHIHEQDSISLIYFTHKVFHPLPLTLKAGNSAQILESIRSLTGPNGSTALYDAMSTAIDGFSNTRGEHNDWIVALTDGGDNSSSIGSGALCEKLKKSQVNTVVLGIGSDVETTVLTTLASAAKLGKYIFAEGNKESIDQAFGEVAVLITGQMVLEEY